MARRIKIATLALSAVVIALIGASSAAARPPGVSWMKGYAAPGTPAKYNRVGVLKIGPATAKNVLVLEPGTSAGSAYFAPLAKWIVATVPGWQVWAVERRQNLLEDQSELNLVKRHKATVTQSFDYYLGYLTNPNVKHHIASIPTASVEFAKQWGMKVAVEDLHRVIAAARKLGGKVVLGGHSLGGSVVTAYATWNFGGHAGADHLAGLVYDDGGSSPLAVSAQQAQTELTSLDAPSMTPWLSFGGIPAPYAGIFEATGSLAALFAPNARSLGQESPVLPSYLKPSVPVTNLAQYGFALNVGTSVPALAAAQGHLGKGLSATAVNGVYGWNGAGALTPLKRFAEMFAGYGYNNVDGTEWYFPQRLADDTGAVGNGNANPAQQVLDVDSTMGHKLSRKLLILAICTSLGGAGVLTAARILAQQSQIPSRNLTLINRASTYAHNDPAGAYPHNAFFTHLVKFLKQVSRER